MPRPSSTRRERNTSLTVVSETTAVRKARERHEAQRTDTALPKTKKGRSPARIVVYDGIRFASKEEGKRYLELRAAQERGEISDLRCHPEFLLDEAFVDNDGTAYRPCRYTADFLYRRQLDGRWVWVVEDFKGWKGLDKSYPVRKRWFRRRYPQFIFVESGTRSRRRKRQTPGKTKRKH